MLVSTLMHKDWYAWIGKRVSVNNYTGTLKYFGEIKAKGGFWCGIEFDEPIGNTDGTISSIQYFKCETNFGIFVPMHEVNRSTELTHCLDKKKPKVNALHSAASKKPRSRMSLVTLNRTSDKNKNKPVSTSCGTTTKVENSQAEIKNVNVRKRSKNSSHRVGTEESLGILSNLLEDDGSFDELATHDKVDDSVFSPPITKEIPHLKPQLYQTQFDKQVPFNIKCASTPKPSFKTVLNLGATVKLDDLHFDHSFHDEIEPIIAGSNATKSMDFDLTNFKQSEVLCSTSKLTLPILPNESPVLKEIPCITNELDCNGSFKDDDAVERVLVNTFSIAQEVPKSTNTNVFNATYELIPEQLENFNAQSEQDTNEILVLDPTAVNGNKKSTGMVDLNATFVLCSNSPSQAKEADKTFVLDHSPAKPLESSSSVESEINFEKKSLSVIFESTMNESMSANNALEHIDKIEAMNNSFQKLNGDKNNMNLTVSSKMMDKFDEISNSSVKITDGKEIVTDLNSTFCVAVEDVESKSNQVLNNVNKRCSLSSISAKNNISTQPRKSDILDNKFIKHPQSINNQKLAFKIPAPYGAAMKTKVIKNPTISISNKKDEVRDKIVSEDTSKSSSKDIMKAKGIEATSRVTEPPKRIVNSYKSVNRQTQQKENEVHVTLKITDKNTQIVARRKSVGGVVTKVTSKISYGSNRKSISENSNINLKVNKEIKNLNACSSNLTNAKNGVVNRRHTMLPAISIGTQSKAGIAKSKSDLSSNARTDNKPLILKDKSLQSSTNQNSFGNKNENTRDNLIKKPAHVERPKEDIPKDISSKLDNKQNEKPIVPRRELLKPGTLSRLPIAAKSIKKPGFLATGAKSIKT